MKRSRKLPGVVKTTLVFAAIGLVNALIGIGVTLYLNTHFPADHSALYAWQDIVLWIWPAGLMMMPATTVTVGTIYGLVVSIIANGYIYGMLGLLIGLIRHKYKADKSGVPSAGLRSPALRDAKKAVVWAGVISAITSVLAVPWYIPAYRRTGTVFNWRTTLYGAVFLWILLSVVIFLPLFLQSGLRARRRAEDIGSTETGRSRRTSGPD